MIRENDIDSESDKENTQTQSYFSQVLDLPASSKSSQYRSYLEELNDNVNINELESIVSTNKESSNSPNNMKTSNNNVKNGNDSKRKTNVNIENNDSKKFKRWTWTSEMVETLLLNIVECKSEKEFEGLDFEADMIAFYSRVREMMAEMFPPTDFGPKAIKLYHTDNMTTEEILECKRKSDTEKKQIKEGYSRVKIKIKELRRGYKNTVDTGSRSGSGRLVSENFELLRGIWGGSPAVTSLQSAITSQDNQHDTESAVSDSEAEVTVENVALGINTDTAIKVSKKEAHPTTNPKENKRNHMAKNLSSQQRNMMLLNIAREELYIKNKVYETMNKQMEQAERHSAAVVESMNNVGSGIKDGLAMLANAISHIQPSTNDTATAVGQHSALL